MQGSLFRLSTLIFGEMLKKGIKPKSRVLRFFIPPKY